MDIIYLKKYTKLKKIIQNDVNNYILYKLIYLKKWVITVEVNVLVVIREILK